MAEGGHLPWKRQVIDVSRGPVADYSNLRKPLPPPPRGFEWRREENGEWKLLDQSLTPAVSGLGGGDDKDAEEEEKSADSVKKQQPCEGVDYVFHTVLPSDTLAGLCLRYKVSATKLRQANKFSGSNLLLAPARLIIPLRSGTVLNVNAIQLQDTNSSEYKLQIFLTEFPHLRQSERRAYLELNDWSLADAMRNAADDDAWEQDKNDKKAKAEEARKAHSLSRLHKNKTTNNNWRPPPPTYAEVCPAEGLLEPLLKNELELAHSPSRLHKNETNNNGRPPPPTFDEVCSAEVPSKPPLKDELELAQRYS